VFWGMALTFLVSIHANAQMLYLGAGTLSHNLARTSGSADAESAFLGTTYPSVFLSGRLTSGGITLAPTIGYTIFSHHFKDHRLEGDDSTTSILTTAVLLASRTGALELHGGLGMLFYRISGSGGIVEIENGTSTSNFALPARSMTSRALYIDLGPAMYLGPLRLDLDFLITGLFSERRAVSMVFALNYGVL
jgi:hypothetical protein